MPKKHLKALLVSALNAVQGEVPEWVELIPAANGGIINGRDGRWWRISDMEALALASKDRLTDYGCPVDEVHSTQLTGRYGASAPAFGWIVDFRVSDSGALEGRVEWTDLGENAVKNRHYRFLSAGFDYFEADMEVAFVFSAGLTNDQNLSVKALNQLDPASAEALNHQNKEEGMLKALLMALCGKEDATQEEALNAVQVLKDAKTALNTQGSVVPKADYDQVNTALNAAQSELKTIKADTFSKKVESAINSAVEAGKVNPASKDFWLKTITTDEALNSFQEDFVAKAPVLTKDQQTPEGDPPGTGSALNQAEKQLGDVFGNSAEDLEKYGA